MNMLLRCFLAGLTLAVVSVSAAPKHTPPPAAKAAFDRATTLAKEKDKQADATVAAFIEAIEADPDFYEAHESLKSFKYALFFQVNGEPVDKPAFEKTMAVVEKKYREWEQRWPNSPGVAWGIVMQFYWVEDPGARPYLLKIVERWPDDARAWMKLSGDAEMRGDGAAARAYIQKAVQAEPDDPNYAFYYVSTLDDISLEQWEAASLELARRFPTSDRGAQALYWLGQRSKDDNRKIRFFELARRDFPVAKFRWSASASVGLFEVYLRTAPDKAIAIAREMVANGGEDAKTWAARVEFAESYAQVKQLVDERKFDEANALIDKLTVDRRSSNPVTTLLLKAEVLAGAGNHQGAYDLLLQRFTPTPDDELHAALVRHGARLNKDAKAVSAETWALRDAAARLAPGFDLGLYTSDQKLSLASLRGKVVFVTFWFPGCGPCRAEFPHFENVLAKFKGNKDLVYLGINGVRSQDDYVLPFMQATKHTFTPLKGEKSVNVPAPEGYNVSYYPTNFLIDRDGRIVFSNFGATDENSERVLQRMIEALLARPAKA